MNSMKILQQAVNMVTDSSNSEKAVELVREHFEDNKVEAGFNKDVAKKRLEHVIALGTGKKELEIEPIDLFFLGMGEKREVKPFSDDMIEALKNIVKIIGGVEVDKCDHSNAKVIPLLYGGGFTPTMVEPELVCPDCGLNVTLTRQRIIDAGLSKEYIKELYEWGSQDNKEKGVQSSSHIATRTRELFDKSKQYDGDMEPIFKIIDKIEEFSGQ